MTDDQILEKPIIILGAPRSGTTMLGDLIGQHPMLAKSVEPRLIWRWGNDRGSDMLKPERATTKVKKHIRSAFAKFVREQNKKRLLEKTPSNSLRPEFVHAIFPDAKFVHVMRHGLDSVLSLRHMTQCHAHGIKNIAKGRLRQRLSELEWNRLHHYAIEFSRRVAPPAIRSVIGHNPWGPRVPGIHSLMKELDPLEVAAIQWRMCVETTHSFGKNIPKEQFFEFRLEDMSRKVLENLLKFTELENSESVLRHFDKNFKPDYANRQRKQHSKELAALINRQIKPTLCWLGYDS